MDPPPAAANSPLGALPGPDERPNPPRCWWLRRGLAAFGALLAATGAIWFTWDATTAARLEARLDSYRARGEPVDPADFNPTARLPDEENAAYFLNLAVASWRDESEMLCPMDLSWIAGDIRVIQRHPEWVRRTLDANPEAWALVRRAAACKRSDSNVRLGSPVYAVVLPWLSPSRDMAKRCASAAVLAAIEGDSVACVEYIRDMFGIARNAARRPKTIIGALVHDAAEELAIRTLETTLPMLDVDDPCVREVLLSAQADLLDDGRRRELWRAGLYFERACVLDGAQLMLHGKLAIPGFPAPAGASSILAPFVRTDSIQALNYFDRVFAALDQDSFPGAQTLMPPFPESSDLIGRHIRPVSAMLLPALEGAMNRAFRQRSMRRMAALAIATRLYQADFGRIPAELSDLVPHFLPGLPRDPFAASDETFLLQRAHGRTRLCAAYVNLPGPAGISRDDTGLTMYLDGLAPAPLSDAYGEGILWLIEAEPNQPATP